MDKSLLVEVFVPTFDADRRDGGGRVGEVATGYPVGNDLVLTARHALAPEDRDERYNVAIRWHDYPDARVQGGWLDLARDAVVWKGEGPLDAALLRVERPPQALGAGFVSAEHPRYDTRFEAAGFPRAGKFEGKRHPVSFGGLVHSMSANWDYFEVTVEAAPDIEKGWSGASGMPIFVDGKIMGVTQRVPKGFRSGRLHVVPSWKLLSDPKFRNKIAYDDQEAHRRSVRPRLALLLRRSKYAVKLLVEQSDLDALAQIDHQNAHDVAGAILDAGLELDDLIDGLLRVHASLREELNVAPDDSELKEVAQTLVDVAQLLAPALVDHGMVAGVRRDCGGGPTPLVQVPVCLPTAVEVVMAGADGCAANFRARVSETDYPAGVCSLAAPPECGIGRFADQGAAVLDHASAKLAPDLFRKRFGEAVVRDYVGATAAKTREQQLAAAVVELSTRLRVTRRRFYLALPVPGERAGSDELQQLASDLKRDLPPVVCLGIDASYETEMRDRERYGPLCQMLPLQE